ncbi:hypothetical protein [Solitalea koreensis]|uniref:Cytochrome C Planctomycete-type domain-containing protein n=1 Tax=Solitalea koreensis TaxID=543615 RepID=A0A521B9P7_9SPHI|nr:hypothetical protein [Solitalea koreensis]SMO43818.1 hypothetical protein SAMN06265350_10224 [Solitalea koreensis]
MMRLKNKYSLVLGSILHIIAGVIGATSCKHDPDLSNTPTISYSNDVQPILIANCTQSGCHGNVYNEGFKLLSYNDVLRHIKPGSATGSQLNKVITAYGNIETQMPPPPNRHLNDQEVSTIYLWILQGAKNN